MINFDEKLGEALGRIGLLEKLVTDLITNQLIEVKLKAINAETLAVRATEIVQEVLSGMGTPQASEMDDAEGGYLDVRGGVSGRMSKRGKVDNEPD